MLLSQEPSKGLLAGHPWGRRGLALLQSPIPGIDPQAVASLGSTDLSRYGP